MRKFFLLIALFFLTLAESAYAERKPVFEWRQGANDFAICKFSFYPDGLFEIRFAFLEGSDAVNNEKVQLTATYIQDSTGTTLILKNKRDLKIVNSLLQESTGIHLDESTRKILIEPEPSRVLCLGMFLERRHPNLIMNPN